MSVPLLLTSSLLVISYKSIISPLIETISSTTTLIKSIMTHNTHPHINDKLKELDILSKIEIISLFLLELETYNSDTDEQRRVHFMKTFEILIKKITSIIEMIKINLKKIQIDITYHNSLYFSYWRTLNCEKEFELIIQYDKLLTKQFKMLIDILSIGRETKTIITYMR